MTGENFPPPLGVADEIIAKAIELLNADTWESETETHIVIRTVTFNNKSADITIPKDGSEILKYGKPSTAYRQAFIEAYTLAMHREREKRLRPLLKTISNKHYRLPRRLLQGASMTVGLIVTFGLAALAVGGVTSCSEQQNERIAMEAEREQKAGELVLEERLKVLDAVADGTLSPDIPSVNKYGFKRANLPTRYVWPDGCNIGGGGVVVGGYRYDFSSIYDCKSQFESWESYGTIWVDWKAEP